MSREIHKGDGNDDDDNLLSEIISRTWNLDYKAKFKNLNFLQ